MPMRHEGAIPDAPKRWLTCCGSAAAPFTTDSAPDDSKRPGSEGSGEYVARGTRAFRALELGTDREHTGNQSGNSSSSIFAIPPLQPRSMALAIPFPTQCPKTAGRSILVGLGPQGLGLLKTFREHLADRYVSAGV